MILDTSSTQKTPAIHRWLVRHPRSRPFVWTKTADEILGTDHHILAKPETTSGAQQFVCPVVSESGDSFSFGLGHGVEFSSTLRELGLPTHGLLLSLFGFNAGGPSW